MFSDAEQSFGFNLSVQRLAILFKKTPLMPTALISGGLFLFADHRTPRPSLKAFVILLRRGFVSWLSLQGHQHSAYADNKRR